MARRHQEHLKSYLDAHKSGSVSKTSADVSNQSRSSNQRPVKDVPVLFTSNARSGSSYMLGKKQLPARVHGTATINHLPDELLLKIFCFLDVGDLLMAARVCKRWLPIAKDNILWEKIIAKHCEIQKNTGASHTEHLAQYKTSYIKSIASNRNKKAQKLLKKVNPFTGLPRDFDKALKLGGVYFQITLIDHHETECVLNSNDVFYHQMAASVRWFSLEMPKIKTIKRVLVHAVNPLFFNKKGTAIWNSPYQRSLLLSIDFNWNKWLQTIKPSGSDDMVNLFSLQDGFMVATWKGDGELAFLSLGLHCNQLVNRCMLGTPSQPYDLGKHKVLADDIDSAYGLHDYGCTVEIRTLRNSIWSQQFNCLSCKKEKIGSGYAVFELIRKDHHCDHVILQKKLQFPWKTDAFRGTVDNVVWIDVTVLDERKEPFWCTSSMSKIAEQSLQKNYDFDYSNGDCHMLSLMDERGKLEAQMSKTDDDNFFMTVMNLKLSLDAINAWFGTKYT